MLRGAFDDGVATYGGASDATDLHGKATDFTLLDGAFLPANSVQRKVWRLQPDELSPGSWSLLRDDLDDCLRLDRPARSSVTTSGKYLGRHLSDFGRDTFQFHHNPDEPAGTFDATFEFTVPSLSGVYRWVRATAHSASPRRSVLSHTHSLNHTAALSSLAAYIAGSPSA